MCFLLRGSAHETLCHAVHCRPRIRPRNMPRSIIAFTYFQKGNNLRGGGGRPKWGGGCY